MRPLERRTTLVRSFYYASRGLATAWKEERNFRVQLVYLGVVAALFGWLKPPLTETLVAALSVSILLTAELFNTALERAVDLTTIEDHPLACQAKDLAAGAVMLTSFVSAGTVLSILFYHDALEVVVSLGVFLLLLFNVRFGGGRL